MVEATRVNEYNSWHNTWHNSRPLLTHDLVVDLHGGSSRSAPLK